MVAGSSSLAASCRLSLAMTEPPRVAVVAGYRSATLEGESNGLTIPGCRCDAVVAQLVLQHPPDGVPWQVGPELDVAGHREVRDVVDRPQAQRVLGQARAVDEHHRDLHVV